MLGTLNREHKEVTIVGAGISGLILAEALDADGWQVTLLEAYDDAGGMIRTREARLGIAEAAAHAIQATPAVRALCERLGVALEPVRPDSRARYVWRGGKPRKLPLSAWEIVRTLFRAYGVLADPKADPAYLSLEQWGRRHLGEAAVKYLLTPFVRGIYGARPSEINVAMAFPALVVPRGHSLFSWMLRRWHLRLRGKGGPQRPRAVMMAPVLGMGSLVQALESRLRDRLGDRFKTGVSVRVLPHSKNIVLCVPAAEAATILSEEDPALSQALERLPHSPLVSVTAFTERESFPSAPRGVGVLLPEGTSRKTLGVLYNSSSFSNRVVDESRWVSLTLMMGGTEKPELVHSTDQEILAFTRDDLEKLYDLAPGARLETVIHRWERAIPLYGEALRAAWDAANAGWCSQPGRLLFGNYTGQVSIRGMIETVSALTAAR
jgi:oxygen-dependent protoporphyrinogen oxidase